MAFDDRLLALLLGVVIGFVVGYFVRLVQEIKTELDEVKKELDEVDTIVKETFGNHNGRKEEGGFMRHPWPANIAVALVVVISFWAAVQSQEASNKVKDSQERMEQVVSCLAKNQIAVTTALNERATYSTELATANIVLQQAQNDFFEILLHQPPYAEARRSQAALDYFAALQSFLNLAKKNQGKLVTTPFPTTEDFSECLRKH